MSQHRWRRQLGRLLPRLAPSHSAYAGPETSDRVSVWAAVDELTPRQRHVVYLHYAADLPFDEVALIVGISPMQHGPMPAAASPPCVEPSPTGGHGVMDKGASNSCCARDRRLLPRTCPARCLSTKALPCITV